MKVYVIGGGASGMLAAICAARNGSDVVILEKNEKTGKKLFITGKGRCNLTNASSVQNHIDNTVHNAKFMNGVLRSFDSEACMLFFENLGVPLKIERGNRVFPVSDKSNDILQALNKEIKRLGIEVHLSEKVVSLQQTDGKIFEIRTEKNVYSDIQGVILATGGITYPTTGSTGDGYVFSAFLGHNVIEPKPSLCDIILKNPPKNLQGVALKNVTGKITDKNGKTLFFEFGEMLFTDEGVGGPIVLSLSARICRSAEKTLRFVIDLKPALTEDVLDKRLLRDFEQGQNKNIKTVLCGLVPKALTDNLLQKTDIPAGKSVNSITKEERKKIVYTLKNFSFDIEKTDDKRAVITSGGVATNEIDPKTMRSKRVENLYFCGEIIDVDAMTGGYNLQIAFSTGYAAGTHISI